MTSNNVMSSDDQNSSQQSSPTEGSNDDFDVRIFSSERQQQQQQSIRSTQSTPCHFKSNSSPKNEFSLEEFGLSQDMSFEESPSNKHATPCLASSRVFLATKEGSMRRSNSNFGKVRRKRAHDIHTPTHVGFDDVLFDDRPHTSHASHPSNCFEVHNNTTADSTTTVSIPKKPSHPPTHKTRSSVDVTVQLPSNLIIPQYRQYSSFRTPTNLTPNSADSTPWRSPNHAVNNHVESKFELPKLKLAGRSRSSLNVTDGVKEQVEVSPQEPIPSMRSSRANIDFVIDISSEEVRRDVLPSPVVNQNMKEKFSSEKTKTDNFYNDVHVGKESKKVDSNSIFFYSLKKVLKKTCSLVLKPSECIEFVECKGLGSVYLVPESEKPKRKGSPTIEKKKSKKVNLPLMDDLSDDEIGRFLMESEEEDNSTNYKALVLYDSWEGIDLCTKSLTEEVDDRVTIFGHENDVNEYHIIIRGDVKVYYRNRYDLAVNNK